jgi:hypothetical protein
MKKTLVTIAVAALTVSSFAQGTLNVGNFVNNVFNAPIYGPQLSDPTVPLTGNTAGGLPVGTQVYTGPRLQGTGFTFAVYFGAASVVDPNALTLLTTATFRTSASGNAPAGLITTQSGFAVPGIAAGSKAALQIRVWDNAGGTINNYNAAGTHGQTPIFLSADLGGTGPNGPVLTPDMTGWQSFNIYIVPEPATFALAGLGAAALLIFRRRK